MKADWLVRSDSARHIPEDLVWATIPPHIRTSPWPPTLKRCENAAIRETHLYIQLQLVGKRKRLITTGYMLWIYIFKTYLYPLYFFIILIFLMMDQLWPTQRTHTTDALAFVQQFVADWEFRDFADLKCVILPTESTDVHVSTTGLL